MVSCPKCRSTQVVKRVDRDTRQAVAVDGKVLSQCRKCGEVFISTEYQWDRMQGRSYLGGLLRLSWVIIVAALCLGLAILENLTGFGVPWQWALPPALALGFLKGLDVVLRRIMANRRVYFFEHYDALKVKYPFLSGLVRLFVLAGFVLVFALVTYMFVKMAEPKSIKGGEQPFETGWPRW